MYLLKAVNKAPFRGLGVKKMKNYSFIYPYNPLKGTFIPAKTLSLDVQKKYIYLYRTHVI